MSDGGIIAGKGYSLCIYFKYCYDFKLSIVNDDLKSAFQKLELPIAGFR